MKHEQAELRCGPGENGQRLLKHLLRTTDGTKILLYKLFRKGAIKVNGSPVDKAYVLKEGDAISHPQLKAAIGAKKKFHSVPRDVSVLYEDDLVVAVDKNDSTLVHAAGSGYKDSLLEMVKAHLYHRNQPHAEVYPVHRIDRNTRGVVLFSKNLEAAKKVNAAFKNGEVEKTYEALLMGNFLNTVFVEGDIIQLDSTKPVQVQNLRSSNVIPDKKQWLEEKYRHSKTISGTVITPVGHIENNRYTVADITIWTGRHHQIRAIAKAVGYPVAGDKKYFNSANGKEGEGIGQTLICKRIIIEDLGIHIESRYSIL